MKANDAIVSLYKNEINLDISNNYSLKKPFESVDIVYQYMHKDTTRHLGLIVDTKRNVDNQKFYTEVSYFRSGFIIPYYFYQDFDLLLKYLNIDDKNREEYPRPNSHMKHIRNKWLMRPLFNSDEKRVDWAFQSVLQKDSIKRFVYSSIKLTRKGYIRIDIVGLKDYYKEIDDYIETTWNNIIITPSNQHKLRYLISDKLSNTDLNEIVGNNYHEYINLFSKIKKYYIYIIIAILLICYIHRKPIISFLVDEDEHLL
ncbi:MAG: DUF2167 domain-containing protein [Hyphomicrobiales bacterium]